MAKISDEGKRQFNERVDEYKKSIAASLENEKAVLADIIQNPIGAESKKIKLADERLNLASLYLLVNRISLSVLGNRDGDHLEEARRSCYQCVIYLEQVVSNTIDAPYSDYAKRLEAIEDISAIERYRLVQKMGFTIRSVEDDFGKDSKWKWSFVELEGRSAVVTKNLINLKTVVAGLDPRVPGYEARMEHLQLVKDLLNRSADRYREKFEFSTNRNIADFREAITFLAALRRMQILLGETEQAENVKKKFDVWKSKMEVDEKTLDDNRK